MSARWTEGFAWLRERYPLGRFVPLAVFLAMAAQAGLSAWAPADAAWSALLALGLVLQLRLWDDLESLPKDRREHPERVLCRARSLTPFLALLGGLTALGALGLMSQPRALLGYAALCAFLGVWYRWLAPQLPEGPLAAHGVLIKYPAIVALLHWNSGGAGPPPLVLGLVFLCFGVYELLHDSRLRARPGTSTWLRVEMLGLLTISLAITLPLACKP